ncbi:MAG TPA: alpha-ketoglutarate-dependent dioxygenase AlkB [Pyrinomonadaceae bacterium]|jgi:alkylated DNA repair dioxygenase AlkB
MNNNLNVSGVQPNLFLDCESIGKEVVKENYSMPDAEITFYPNFFNKIKSDVMFENLFKEIKWRSDKIKLYGKEFDLPRKTAWYGEQEKSYKYSGIEMFPEPWTPTLLEIKQEIEKVSDTKFNSVMMNLYRDGNDGISWHTDAEPELGRNPTIASVSFGQTRRFMLRHRNNKELKFEIELTHGSLLLMGGPTQHFWQHQIPKTSRKLKPRINLTFRVIIN